MGSIMGGGDASRQTVASRCSGFEFRADVECVSKRGRRQQMKLKGEGCVSITRCFV